MNSQPQRPTRKPQSADCDLTACFITSGETAETLRPSSGCCQACETHGHRAPA